MSVKKLMRDKSDEHEYCEFAWFFENAYWSTALSMNLQIHDIDL